MGPALRDAVFAATFGERYLAYELLGGALIFLATRPRARDWLHAAVYGALIGLACLHPPAAVRPFPALFAATALLGMGTLLVMAERVAVHRRPHDVTVLAVMLAPVAFRTVRLALLRLTPALLPQTYDLTLYRFDAGLGVQLSFVLGRTLHAIPPLEWAIYRLYIAIPLAIAGLYTIWLVRRDRPAVNIVLITIVMSLTGYLCYFAVPACGPLYQFGERVFPAAAPPAASLPSGPAAPADAQAPRNCVPSLHFGWALMVLLNTRGLPRAIRAAAAAFLGCIVLATLGLGEHYAVDLVVAFPFTVLWQAACNRVLPLRSTERWQCMIWGATVTIAWLLLLRAGAAVDAPVAWAAVLATIAGSILLERRVAAASSMPALITFRRPVSGVAANQTAAARRTA